MLVFGFCAAGYCGSFSRVRSVWNAWASFLLKRVWNHEAILHALSAIMILPLRSHLLAQLEIVVLWCRIIVSQRAVQRLRIRLLGRYQIAISGSGLHNQPG